MCLRKIVNAVATIAVMIYTLQKSTAYSKEYLMQLGDTNAK